MKPPDSPERAERVWNLFNDVVDLAPEARAAHLGEESDPGVRSEVEDLLDAHLLSKKILRGLDDALGPYLEDRRSDELLGRLIGRYRIEEKLGGGGMGVVYRAYDTRLDRTIAMKFLQPHLDLDGEAKARFIHEAKAASALDHPNICTVHDIGELEDGRLFIVMAYYAGETLKARIARGTISVAEVLDYAQQVLQGLESAHSAGIIHRDVKPANIMVIENGGVKLVDFGLAKVQDISLTRTGMTPGTVCYMSPEQASGSTVDHRTDLWSLGVALYEMLTGRRPFQGEYGTAVLYAILHEEPESVPALRSEVPDELARVVEKLLRKDPEVRYQRAQNVLVDIRLMASAADTRKVADRGFANPRLLRRRVVMAAGVGLLLLVFAVLGRVLIPGGRESIGSIAVLPLANLHGDSDHAYLADGMTDELIDRLGRIEALRVISRTSVMRYKESDKSLPEIARELGVAAGSGVT